MTHRVFSRNAASSRAIPTNKKIERIRQDCAKPSEWGVNQKGMQSGGGLDETRAKEAEFWWRSARDSALKHAELLDGLGLHKQVANRILEPFDHITVVLSTTKLKNHFALRLATDQTGRPFADPTYFELAKKWKEAWDASTPTLLTRGQWHLPYVGTDERPLDLATLKRISVGRCARVSYMRQGEGDVEENVKLHDRLAASGHWSPFEHVATPMEDLTFGDVPDGYPPQCDWCSDQVHKKCVFFKGHYLCLTCAHGHIHSGNFHGWNQYRKEFANEAGGD
jgi:hypothetical protein